MSDRFEKSTPQQENRSFARVRADRCECAGASVGGQSDASGSAGAGEDHGGTA